MYFFSTLNFFFFFYRGDTTAQILPPVHGICCAGVCTWATGQSIYPTNWAILPHCLSMKSLISTASAFDVTMRGLHQYSFHFSFRFLYVHFSSCLIYLFYQPPLLINISYIVDKLLHLFNRHLMNSKLLNLSFLSPLLTSWVPVFAMNSESTV